MATPDRDPSYNTTDTNRTVYTREKSGTGWFVGIIVVLALLAIGYLVFSANRGATTGETAAPVTETSAPATSSPVSPSVTTAPSTSPSAITPEAAPSAPSAPAPSAAPAATTP